MNLNTGKEHISARRKMAVMLAFLLSLGTVGSQAQGNKGFGAGLILGNPMGLSAKYWLTRERALDFAFAWSGQPYHWGPYGYYYTDDRCHNPNFYDDNRSYCRDRRRDDGDPHYRWRALQIHADYLIHNYRLFKTSKPLALYYGPGLVLGFHPDYMRMGVRGALGIVYGPSSTPVDVFFEIAPVFVLYPGPWLDANGGIGARFYF